MKISFKSMLVDASREYTTMNINIWDYFHGAASTAATQGASWGVPVCFLCVGILIFYIIHAQF